MRHSKLITFTLVLVPFAAAVQADIIVGTPADPKSGAEGPFDDYHGEYQQVYTSSLFPGPYDITGLEFFNTVFQALPGTNLGSGSIVISLSATAANWNTLSNTFSANIGPVETQVFSGTIGGSWTTPGTLTFPLRTPFVYDPSQGNLLVDIQSHVSGGGVFFDINGLNQPNNFMGRVFLSAGTGPAVLVANGFGLVTDFEGAPVSGGSSLPEPSSVLLLSSALGGLAYFGYHRGGKKA